MIGRRGLMLIPSMRRRARVALLAFAAGAGRPLLGALALGACLLSPHAVAQPRVEAPILRVGDQWTYMRLTPGPTRAPDEIARVVTLLPGQRAFIESIRTLDGRGAANMDAAMRAGREQRHLETLEPLPARVISGATPWIAFPIEVGKAWRYTRRWSDNQGAELTDEGSAEAQAIERVEVPAGAFNAFRIRHRWRTMAAEALEWPREMTLWYAPEVKRWVKLEYAGQVRGAAGSPLTERYRLELTSFDVEP